MKVYCPHHDEVIPRSETVRGYEWSKGKYVVVTDEDIDSVPLKTMRAIEIELFVKASRDNAGTQFVKQAYYLEPEQIGAKAFYLLKSVLAEQNKSAICKIVLKDREQLAALNPFAKTMLLTTLHWPDEVRAIDELALPEDEIEIKASEKKMAEQLVASMTGEFDADDYADDYRQALMAVIEKKVAGEKPEPQDRAEPTNITDLMAALEASVAAARSDRTAASTAAGRQVDEDEGAGETRQQQGRRERVGGARQAPSQDGLTSAGRARRAARPSHRGARDARAPACANRRRCSHRPVPPPSTIPPTCSSHGGPGSARWRGSTGHALIRLRAAGLADALVAFAELVDELPERLQDDGVVLDGWLLALDDGGWLDGDLLRRRLAGDPLAGRPAFVASTCSGAAGSRGSAGSFAARRRRLEEVLRDGDRCVVSHALPGDGTLLAEALARFGIEGISARRLDARTAEASLATRWLRLPVRPAESAERPRLALIQRLPLTA